MPASSIVATRREGSWTTISRIGGPFASAIRESLLLDGERGVSFIGSHASMDAKHMAELRLVLNPIDDISARDAIVESVQVNFHQFTRIVEAL